MKKIIFTILIFALVFTFVFSISASAQGEDIASDTDNASSNAVQDTIEGEDATFFGRIWEAVTSEKNGILDRALDLTILAGFAILGRVVNKFKGKITTDVTSLGANNAEAVKEQSTLNKRMIDGFNGLIEEVSELEKRLDGVIKNESAVASLLTVNMTILEMFSTIYPKSKSLPQGVKDIVELLYAKCLKTINDEEKLAAIINAIHGNSEVCSDDESNKEQTV